MRQGFRVRVAGDDVLTSMLTKSAWLDPAELGTGHDALAFVPPSPTWFTRLDDVGVSAPVDRLASVEVKAP